MGNFNKEPLLDFLTNNPDSPVHQTLQKPVPENDLEYLEMWKTYYHYSKLEKDHFNTLVTEWGSDLPNNNIQLRHELWSDIRKILKEDLDKKLASLPFKPRVETYAETFSEWEQNDVRMFLIHALVVTKEIRLNDRLIDMTEAAQVQTKWALSLTENHRLFNEGVFELENSYRSNEGIVQEKDVKLGFSIRKIFSGVELSNRDLLIIKDSPLIQLFGLADESQMRQLFSDHEDLMDNDEKSDFELDHTDPGYEKTDDDEDDIDLETLISELKNADASGLSEEQPESDEDQRERDLPENSGLKKSGDHEDGEVDESLSEIEPYEDDLDFLYQEYEWIKMRSELLEKKYNVTPFDNDDKNKIRFLKQEYTQKKNLADLRLRESIKKGFTPRLIKLSRHLKLSEIELNIIKILVVDQLFIEGENSYKSHSKATVGALLLFSFDNTRDTVKARKLFLKDSRLVKSNLVQVERSGLESSFFESVVTIDNRLVEYLVGEDYDISNYIEGSYLYKPVIKMDNVVLPQNNKTNLLKTINHFPTFLEAKKNIKVPDHITYGDSLVMLFTGPSGTGKTMLGYAVANHLDKRVLIINLNNLSGMSSIFNSERGIFSLLFREARMNDAILFFDEAEELLTNRFQDLLIEIEKHHGIVIFATNASFKVDDALRRRINHVQHFRDPGPHLRKQIWEMHLPEKVQLDADVDLNELALRYEINGGLIKNAVFSALAKSVGSNGVSPIVLKMEHLTQGASEQLQNKLFMSKLEKHKTPKKGFDDAVFPDGIFRTLKEIARYDKAKKVLEGEWNFRDIYPDLGGVSVLFHGPPGVGKTMAAELLAFETGKNLKVVNYAQLISKYVGDTEKALETLFEEVAESNSILLFDEADAIFASRTEVSSVNDRYANIETDVLLGLIEEINSIVILTTNYIENIDKAFYRRLRYIVEFKTPDAELRKQLWQKLLPPKLPVASDLDIEKLAEKFEFTGGDIKNAVIRAASMRAVDLEETGAVTMDDFVDACRQIHSLQQKNGAKIGFR